MIRRTTRSSKGADRQWEPQAIHGLVFGWSRISRKSIQIYSTKKRHDGRLNRYQQEASLTVLLVLDGISSIRKVSELVSQCDFIEELNLNQVELAARTEEKSWLLDIFVAIGVVCWAIFLGENMPLDSDEICWGKIVASNPTPKA